MPMSPEDMRFFDEKFENLNTKLDGLTTDKICTERREECAKRMELKFENQRYRIKDIIIQIITASGVVGGAVGLKELLGITF